MNAYGIARGYNRALIPPTNRGDADGAFLTSGSRRNTSARDCTRLRANSSQYMMWKKSVTRAHTRRESRCRCRRKRISKSVHLRISTKVRYASIECARGIGGTISACDILDIFAAAPRGQSKHRLRFLRVLRSRFSRKFPRTSLRIRGTLSSQCRSCLTFLSLKLLWRILQLRPGNFSGFETPSNIF